MEHRNETDIAREIAHLALRPAGCGCSTPGVHFVGRQGAPIGEAGGDLIFEATCPCKIRLVLSDVRSDTGEGVNAIVHREHEGRRALVVEREGIPLDEMRQRVARQLDSEAFAQMERFHQERYQHGVEMQALDVLVVDRLTAAGCTHQTLAPFMPVREELKYGPAFEGDHYRVVCLVEGCGKDVIVTLDEAIAAAPKMMAHHAEDRAELARARVQAAVAESLLDVKATAEAQILNTPTPAELEQIAADKLAASGDESRGFLDMDERTLEERTADAQECDRLMGKLDDAARGALDGDRTKLQELAAEVRDQLEDGADDSAPV
jgi:hypothetical protein